MGEERCLHPHHAECFASLGGALGDPGGVIRPQGKDDNEVKNVRRVLSELNRVSGREFRDVPSNTRLIRARIKESSVEDVIAVVHQQAELWRGDPKMWPCVRPKTLFSALNFEQYLGRVLARRARAEKP